LNKLKENIKKIELLLVIFTVILSSIFILSNNSGNVYKDSSTEKMEDEFLNIYSSANELPNKYLFKYYKVIEIDHTKVFGSNNYSNFPVLISILDSDLHEDVQSDGDDIAFANDTNWLDHEIELFNQEYDSSHAQLIAWVRVPLLNIDNNTNITMYYGNPYLSSQENATRVWDKNYKGVWHMSEINAVDSTSNNNDGSESGGVSNLKGKIANANDFGGDDLIYIGNIGSGIKTIEFWMNPSSLGSGGDDASSWKNPSATGVTYTDWTNPINATASDDLYAVAIDTDYQQDWYNFNLNIPNGATINGIHIEVEAASTSSNLDLYAALSGNNGSSYTAEKLNLCGSTEWNETYGDSSELWGEDWSSDNFTNDNFRIKLRRGSSNPIPDLRVDCISLKIYYHYQFMRIIDLDGLSRIEIVEEKLVTTNFPGTTTIYIDGVVDSSLTVDWHYIAITNSFGLNFTAMEIGRFASDFFNGIIDELRVSNVLRTPESFNTTYYNQIYTNSFYNISQEVAFNVSPPTYSNLTESSDQLELGNTKTIFINVTDLSGIKQVKIEFESSNHSMTNIGGDKWQFDSWIPSITGNYPYKIYMEDNCGIWSSVSNSITVIDTTSPNYSNLIESADPLELGDNITINLDINDLSSINQVLITFEGSNHSMTNIGGNTWRYSLWKPSSIGTFTYIIDMEDSHDNWNSLINSITVVDTIPPAYSNLIESADPLELGENATISIDSTDLAGINRVLLEFEGSNHSMINIGGNTWHYDLWSPKTCGLHQYRIYIEDNNNYSIYMMNNITVQDTVPPTPPTITTAPSGGLNSTLQFDWADSFDPSDISYYILIIDNESNPFTTPGFIFRINITNIGPESSFYEYTGSLSPGTYYYFLSQIDGVGEQSDFTSGSFTITSISKSKLSILDILPFLLASVIGSITVIVIVRKRIHKKILPQRKKIPLKMIINHINKISSEETILEKGEQEKKTDDKILPKKELENRLTEIKSLGEELFEEGAYLEAQKQFEQAEELLLKLGNNEEATYYSKFILKIDELNEEREKKLELLEQEKLENNAINIVDLYFDIIGIAKVLKDLDSIEMYESDLIQLHESGILSISDFEHRRDKLEEEAYLMLNQQHFQKAAKYFENCEEVSQVIVKLGRVEENIILEKFRMKRNECIKKESYK